MKAEKQNLFEILMMLKKGERERELFQLKCHISENFESLKQKFNYGSKLSTLLEWNLLWLQGRLSFMVLIIGWVSRLPKNH